MDRFTPETWREALWRPVAMAAPDSGVYIEIMAPDVRFACLAALTMAMVVLALVHRRNPLPRPAMPLLAFTWIAFVPWLMTTSNGRYFLPVLVLAGPLCMALIKGLPFSTRMKLTLAVIVVAVQTFMLIQVDPRKSWGLAAWNDQYFKIELTPQDRSEPAAYVLVTTISYSLLAPQFDHRSRWIGLANVPQGLGSTDGRRAHKRVEQAVSDGLPIKLLVPTVPDRTTAQLQPDPVMHKEINRLLAAHRLALAPAARCEFRRSATMAALIFDGKAQNHGPAVVNKVGFWICPLDFPVGNMAPTVPDAAVAPAVQARANRVFDALEQHCPRVFDGGAEPVRLTDGGFVRQYGDIKAYVMDDGRVYFRYYRALNSNYVGMADKVLAPGFSMDCNHIKGRSGLPWEREI